MAFVAVHPDNAQAQLRLAETNKNLKKNKSAVKAYEAAIKADPNMFAAYYNLGNLQLERQDFEEAEDAFKGAVRIEPKNYKAHFNLAISLHYQSKLSDALAEYEQVVKVGKGKRGASATVKQAEGVIPGLKEQIAADD